jgi:deoxyribodipyrimidine photo-lyase
MKMNLVWFRNDLRTHDHEPLHRACLTGMPVIGIYCFDPRHFQNKRFGFPKTGVHRAKFIIDSVLDLRDRMKKRGFELIVKVGKPEDILPELATICDIHEIYYHAEMGSEEAEVETQVKKNCPSQKFHSYFGHNLIHLEDLPFSPRDLPDVFTQFRKRVEMNLRVRQPFSEPMVSQPTPLQDIGEIPTLRQLGFTIEPEQILLQGGETKGQNRLLHYFFETNSIQMYKDTRNGMENLDDSSKFSPYLAHGCLSAKYIYWKLKEYESKRGANQSTYWLLFELLWRDYFWLVHQKYGNKLFHPGGLFQMKLSWNTHTDLINAWIHGKTGYPLVDANMRELKASGWMSNRGRQNVASFLTKNLGIDWRIGAAWFESCLIDHDVSSNYGNWCYVAGVGNDTKTYRVFNVTKQGKEYDPQGSYAKRWLPEIGHIVGERVYDIPNFSWIEQAGYGLLLGQQYPKPIVNWMESVHLQRQKYENAIKGGKH